MTKLFYVAPISTVEGAMLRNNEHGKVNFRFIADRPDLEDTSISTDAKVLVVLIARDEGEVAAFGSLPGVEAVGDPLSRSATKKVKPEHVTHLKHLGVTESDSVVDIALKASARHGEMKVRGIE